MKALVPLWALLLAAGCGAPPSRETPALPSPPPNPGESVPPEDGVVAFIDKDPVMWREVVDHAMATRGKDLIERYIHSKLRSDRCDAIGIQNTPEELARRARMAIDALEQQVGEAAFKKMLEDTKMTKDSRVEFLARSPEFSDHLRVEKAVAYALFSEGSIEIDTMAFTDEGEAAAFRALASRVSFGEAAARLQVTTDVRGQVAAWPRFRFARGLAPDLISDSPDLEKKLFELKKGRITGVEKTSKNFLVVISVVETHGPDASPYPAVADRVMAEVMRMPPSEDQIRLWMDRLLKSKRIRYEDRYSPGNQGR